MSSVQPPGWRAPPQCPEAARLILEKAVNRYPVEYLDEPITGEVFSSIDDCETRLIAYSLVQGFDIVRAHSDKARGVVVFECVFHGAETRNWRQLEKTVERNDKGEITTDRQRNLTAVRQTGCKWSCRVSYKSVGKRGSGQKGYVLSVKCLDHHGHEMAINPFIFPGHKERLEEFQALKTQARAHRVSIIPYSVSRRVLECADEFGLRLTSREYYNIVRIKPVDGTDEKSIEGLLVAIQEAGFIYEPRIEDEIDIKSNTIISRKLL